LGGIEVLETSHGEIQSANVRRHVKPDLSIVVVAYNIPRELPRTLYSSRYQRHINPDDYEVIIVDNGSDPPVDPDRLRDLAGNFRLIRIDEASPSPAAAVNMGLVEAQGEIIAVMIDGRNVSMTLKHLVS
jgi:glycosyltransferase involved in cell wall biosynthesis